MAYAKTSLRKEKRELREKMRAMGLDYRDIAAEFGRRYRLRRRAAWREAYGWSLQETADRINEFRGDIGLDPGGFAGMTASHLCEYESWPGHGSEPSGRRPTPYLLALLAAVYNCGAIDLIDLADREHLLPAQLLILDCSQHSCSSSTSTASLARSRPTWHDRHLDSPRHHFSGARSSRKPQEEHYRRAHPSRRINRQPCLAKVIFRCLPLRSHPNFCPEARACRRYGQHGSGSGWHI